MRLALGSGPRYMICVTLFCTLRESQNTRPCENSTRNACDSRIALCFGNACDFRIWPCVFSRNMQKFATKSDASGHCLVSWRGCYLAPTGREEPADTACTAGL